MCFFRSCGRQYESLCTVNTILFTSCKTCSKLHVVLEADVAFGKSPAVPVKTQNYSKTVRTHLSYSTLQSQSQSPSFHFQITDRSLQLVNNTRKSAVCTFFKEIAAWLDIIFQIRFNLCFTVIIGDDFFVPLCFQSGHRGWYGCYDAVKVSWGVNYDVCNTSRVL